MNIVLLSGGSGKRLWPLSNDIRSKQFIKMFKNPNYGVLDNNEYESMVQRVYRQIKKVDSDAIITIATSKSQVSAIHNQIGHDVGISVEPYRRDTFPAIALAAAHLYYKQNVELDEAIVVCPVDPYVDDDYFETVFKLWDLADSNTANIVLMGINPTYPSEKYGYIIPESSNDISKVKEFKEKPDIKTAEKYINDGGLWNGGIFAFKLKYILDIAHQLIDFIDYEDLFNKYESLEKISFDYAVVEKESDIAVLRFNGKWMDVGTWNTLSESMDDNTIGNVILNDNCHNVHVINELDVPILAMGLNDIVVSASAEGILVSDKEQSSYIKPYVDDIKQQVMFAEKSWGSYRVIDVDEGSMTIKVTLKPGNKMNYHSHDRRDEVWTIISGKGTTIVDGMQQPVKTGDVITIAAGCKHTIIAESELKIIEVQLGDNIEASDKHKYELEI